MWTSKWEGGLQLKWLCDVRREGLTQAVYLRLHLRHWPRWSTGFQDAHVPDKKFSGISVNIRIWASDGDLCSQYMSKTLCLSTYKVKHGACEDRIDRVTHPTQHAKQTRHAVRLQNGLLELAHGFCR